MNTRKARAVWTILLTTVLVVSVTGSAFASHGLVSLAGSNFEIDSDANLKVDHASPSLDWANVSEIRKADSPSGANDESFGQGAKEDTAVPTIVDGSIPPNKSDLKFFGVYQEGTSASGFLNLFWSRVQDPSGTTNMDFEFNKRQCTPGQTPADPDCSGNGVTPLRSVGDLLIIYDLAQGGTNPVLSIREWTGSAWGPATNLTTSNKATGSINTSPIPAGDSDGLGAHSARTFGEAQLSLSAVFGSSGCQSFGSAYLKSRSSDSFTAALKDFVPPVGVNITNCGTINIHKEDDAGTALAGAVFTLYTDNAPTGGARGAEDTITTLTCTTDASGDCSISSVPFGSYWVVETTTPAGHDTAADQAVTISSGNPTVSLTFVNPRQRGAILITKVKKHAASGSGDHPHAGVDFTVNGVTRTTDANGNVCFDNLLPGSYTVHEVTPAGYAGEADKTVTVDNPATCTDNPYGGETVTFTNLPLTNITVSVDSQIDGGTASTIDCDVASGSTGSNGDGSVSANDLEPGTYVCTIVVDP